MNKLSRHARNGNIHAKTLPLLEFAERHRWSAAPLAARVVLFSLADAHGAARTLELKGRDAWALTELVRAGDQGCTPIDTPGPRWSAYVFKLRRMGLDIATIPEPHGGPYKGTHARYILRSVVHRVSAAGVDGSALQAVAA